MELTRSVIEASGAPSFVALSRRRVRRRGAATFIVLFAVLLLSGLGIWAMQMSSLVDQASGYSRMALQTQYTAELGIHASTSVLSVPGWAEGYYKAGMVGEPCESTRGQTGTPFCKSIYMEDLNFSTQAQATKNILDAGSMGPFTGSDPSALEGRFVVEMTEPQQAIVPGQELSNSGYYRVTLTSRGEVRPTATDACTGAGAQNSVAGRIGMRAHSIIGPITR